MNIEKILKEYIKSHHWPKPEEHVSVGPGTCDRYCRTAHAYADAIPFEIKGQTSSTSWVYTKPCGGLERGVQRYAGKRRVKPK